MKVRDRRRRAGTPPGRSELTSLGARCLAGKRAKQDGGGASVSRGALRAAAQSSVRFARNEAGGAGGGLALYGGASASLGGSGLEFSRNAARVGGGLSLVDSQAAVLSRAVLDGNTAYSEGGAIYALAFSAPAGLSVSGAASLGARGNSAGSTGGGAASYGARWTVDGEIVFSGASGVYSGADV